MDALSRTPTGEHSSPRVVLSVRNLRIVQRGSSQPIFAPLSFDLHEGECLALLGPSGIGKSLTLRALLGLLPDSVHAEFDAYEVGSRNMLECSERDWNALRGSTLALVQQDTGAALDPLQRVDRAVVESARIHRTLEHPQVQSTLSSSLLRQAGFDEPERVSRRWPHELSGGMRQRVVLASALSANPAILLADEPTTALDARVRNSVVRNLLESKAAGKSIVFVSHDTRLVHHIADQVVRILPTVQASALLSHPDAKDAATTQPWLDAEGSPRPERAHSIVAKEASVVLSAREISKRYPSGEGIQRVSLELHSGETLGVLGESGAGKSTLARVVMGLTRPDAGEVRVDGQIWASRTQQPQRQFRHSVQWVPQDALSAFASGMPVRAVLQEAIRTSAALRGEPRPGRELVNQRVQALRADVQLPESVLSHKPRELSGGQRQRVAIARALALRPRVLVCDESVSALDDDVRDSIVDLLKGLSAEMGLALLFISHDVHLIAEIAHRVMVMHQGSVVEQAPTAQLLNHPEHPFTAELIAESGFSSQSQPLA